MKADLICVGNELLTGLIENSNSGYLARKLGSLGIAVRESVVVPDELESIRAALNRALAESDLVIFTGGLGPTDDDLTRDAVAEITGLSMELDEHWLAQLDRFFAERGINTPQNNYKQAQVIKGSRLLPNERGTAPGLFLEYKSKIIILLPGPPRELEQMLEAQILPYLLMKTGKELYLTKTLKCVGLGESMLEAKIKSSGIEIVPPISYIARGYEVNLQIKGWGERIEAEAAIAKTETILRDILGDSIFGSDDDTLIDLIAKAMISHKLTLAVAESCSGGLLSSHITDYPGSSAFYQGGVTAYSAEAKSAVLGIDPALLAKYSAVDEVIAKAMAEKVRQLFRVDYGVGITGVAGPETDESNHQVGLVYIALANGEETSCLKLNLPGSRVMIKERVVQVALDLLRRDLQKRGQIYG